MRYLSAPCVGLVAGVLSMVSTFGVSVAGAQDQPMEIRTVETVRSAVFAGGCFWCVEADFDKIEGVVETVSGYPGGAGANPTYRNHAEKGHLEVVQITYEPSLVRYERLVEYFFKHIDPTDAGGQFCDRGSSYRTAIFAQNERQDEIARQEKAEIEVAGLLDAPIVTEIRGAATFYPAEDYHQDYYKKQPVKYSFYRKACGRDGRIKEIWGRDPAW